MNDKGVTHQGIVQSIAGTSITILADEQCSCDGCAVASLCNKSTSSPSDPSSAQPQELITVTSADAPSFRPGDHVELLASSGSTLSAAWWALILPALLFVGVILGVRLTWPDSGGWSIGAGFGVLALYDVGLYLGRRRLGAQMSWRVRRLDS